MQAIVNAFTTFFAKIGKVVEWFGNLFKAVFVALWDLLKDGVCWVMESLLKIATGVLQSLDVTSISSQVGVWGSIPANVLEVCAALGLGTAFGIITAAIGIRFLLQLIPFVRLGS